MLRELFTSLTSYIRLVSHKKLHLSHEHLSKTYVIEGQGLFSVFRETISTKKYHDEPVVLLVGFRLRFIGSHPLFHYIFQKLCVLTTPFWSGFTGFRTKLWMVDAENYNYMGIYEWYGTNNAYVYLSMLLPILHVVSVHNSVWYKVEDQLYFSDFLYQREVMRHISRMVYA